MTSLIADGWGWLTGVVVVVVAIFSAWFGGKSKGTTETQAKADVKDAQRQVTQAQAVTAKQEETIKVVKSVEQDNQSLSDVAARDRMRNSKYHSKD